MYRQAPPQAEVDMLQNRIRNLCKEMHRIAAATQKLLGSEAEDEVVQDILGKTATGDGLRRAFDGLAWQYGNDLKEKFDAVASACCEIEAILREPDGFAPVTSSSPPDVLAFNDLYEKLADSAPIWGFRPTENSPNFIRLVMWMIGWSDFKQAKNKIMNTRANHKRRIAGK